MEIEIKESLVLPGFGETRKRRVRKKYTWKAPFQLGFDKFVQPFVGT